MESKLTRITDQTAYRRRRFIAGALGLCTLGGFGALRYGGHWPRSEANADKAPVPAVAQADAVVLHNAGNRLTSKHAATHYNNAYEFGWNKADPYRESGAFQMTPWAVSFDGLCAKPGTFDIDELMGMPFSHLEERVYDFRCVEAWSMVIPYNGRPLRDIIRVV
ncbi:MAG: hypothetical protein HOL03_09525, partial [Acidiferrobacteraceae bacterium]|nr:hypothetical protein [Acidiferrobacteraceae bacterium]